jgi:predicted secreted protein
MAPLTLEAVERLRAFVHQNGSKELARTLDDLIMAQRSDYAERRRLEAQINDVKERLNAR